MTRRGRRPKGDTGKETSFCLRMREDTWEMLEREAAKSGGASVGI